MPSDKKTNAIVITLRSMQFETAFYYEDAPFCEDWGANLEDDDYLEIDPYIDVEGADLRRDGLLIYFETYELVGEVLFRNRVARLLPISQN